MSRPKPDGAFSWRHAAALSLLVLGMAMVALSFVWTRVSASRSGWTQEKALAYQATQSDAHRLSVQYGNEPVENRTRALHEKLATAQSRASEMRDELEAARGRPARVAITMRYAGIALAIAGGVALAATQKR